MATLYDRQMQQIVTKYIDAGQKWPASATQIAGWAIARKLWAPCQSTIVNQCADHLAKAMREEYITAGPNGKGQACGPG